MPVKPMTPADLMAWIKDHGYNVSSFCRMMHIHRRTMQHRMKKRSFRAEVAFFMTMFCQAYDLGVRVDGMRDPTPIATGGYRRPKDLPSASPTAAHLSAPRD